MCECSNLCSFITLHLNNLSIIVFSHFRSCQDTSNCTGACRTPPVYCQSARPCTSSSRGYCTSRVHCSNTRPSSSGYVPKSVHSTTTAAAAVANSGGDRGSKGVRGRGGSAEKEGKARTGNHRSSTGTKIDRL